MAAVVPRRVMRTRRMSRVERVRDGVEGGGGEEERTAGVW